MKKIISLITIIITVLNLFSFVYAEDDFYTREKQMKALGILDESKEYSPLDKVTKEDYYSALANILVFGGEAKSSDGLLNIVHSLGLIEDKEETTLKSVISYYDVIKNEVKVLGYEKYMNNFSDNSYFVEAKKLKLNKNIALSGNGTLTWYNAIILLENFFNAATKEYDIKLMEDMAHIYKAEGVVSANKLTALYGEGLFKEEIEVGDIRIKTDKLPEAMSYIGKNVEMYLKYDTSDKTYSLLYIGEKNNTVKFFENTEDLSVSYDLKKLDYYENKKHRSYNLSPALKMIYNDVLLTDYEAADFTPSSGTVTAIDNNSDGIYDVIIVESYQTVPVSSVSYADMKVFGKYTYRGALRSVELKEKNYNDFVFIYKDGEKAKISDIKKDDILSVKINKTGDVNVISVYISDKKTSGKLEQIKSDGKVIFLDEEFKTSKAYNDAVKYNDSSAAKAETGEFYDVYFDVLGEIALMNKTEKINNYALLLKLAVENKMDKIYKIRYMDASGVWHTGELNSKVKINGSSMTDAEAYDELYDKGNFVPQVTIVNLNSKNKVSEIETAIENAPEGYEYLTKTPKKSYTYRFSETFSSEIYLESGATIFIIPENISYDEDDYTVESSSVLAVDYNYKIEAFNCDKFGFTDLITAVRSKDLEDGGYKPYFVVLENGKILDGDGTAVHALTGAMPDYDSIWIGTDDETLFGGIKAGDVIQFRCKDSKAIAVKKVVSLTEEKKLLPENPNEGGAVTAGTVIDINTSTDRIMIDAGTAKRALRLNSGAGYYEYSKRANVLKKINKEDIAPGDYIAVITGGSVVKYVYKLSE